MSKKDFVNFKFTGFDELAKTLKEASAKEVAQISRATVNAVAAEGRKFARGRLKDAGRLDTKSLYRSIVNERMKSQPNKPRSIVGVRRGGKGTRRDPFYHAVLEHGSEHIPGVGYFRHARSMLDQNIDKIVQEQFTKVMERRLKARLKKLEGLHKK